jgi:putative N6-adenine-specific DNA methylase
MDSQKKLPILVTCSRGVSTWLAGEIATLDFPVDGVMEAGVRTSGSLNDCMKLNLELRSGHRVLLQIAELRARDADALYRVVTGLPWQNWLRADGHLCITSSVENESIRDSRFANLKCKDAIVDAMVREEGRRPDSGSERSGMVVHLHWAGEFATIYLDTSGEPLSRRNYRKIPLDAPMQETLAAACILASGWRGDTAFVNPMCGSGTLAIEAALMARNRAPGMLRDNFGFMHLNGFEETTWKKMLHDAKSRPAVSATKIIATDLRPGAIEAAKINAADAGVADAIEFGVCDFRETKLPDPPGVVMLNPEYGVRMGDEAELAPVYRAIGDFFKQKCAGYMGCVFTGNLKLAREIGLRSRRRLTFFNGPLECRLLLFELYKGTRDPGDKVSDDGAKE